MNGKFYKNEIIEKGTGTTLPVPKISYGLIILIDLAGIFYRKGCSLFTISSNHKIPLPDIAVAAHRLEEIGLIGHMPENEDWVYLQEQPQNVYWILEVIDILKKSFC